MSKVSTTTTFCEVEGDYGYVDGVELTCDKCGHYEESAGTSESSLNRCAHLLRENCPRHENNYYVVRA